MLKRATVDSMASDSYLLHGPSPAPACQCKCQCRGKQRSSTPCGVVVVLLLLLAAVMTLAALAYCQRMELLGVHVRVAEMHREFHAASSKLDWLQKYELFKTYETLPSAPGASPHGEMDSMGLDEDDEDDYDDDDDDDDNSPIYPDDENTNVVEGKARSQEDEGVPVPRLEPASGHRLHAEEDEKVPEATTPTTTVESTQFDDLDEPAEVDPFGRRRRRDLRPAGPGVRPQPQLKLYHMLQTPGLAAAAPQDHWSQHGARYPQQGYYPQSRPQPMYAEQAPMAYVTPPHRHVGTSTAAPVASRRSRVMDAAVGQPGLQHRRRHQHLQQQRQRGFQHLQQDVTQEVPQSGAARSVEVGRPRWQQQQQQQRQWRGVQAQTAWPSSTPSPPSWSPTEGWRDPWQDRVRAARSIDASVDVDQTWRPFVPAVVEGPAIAGHFVGDTARHRGTHHYDDNGRLKHPTGEYADWTASPWVRELGLDHHFKLAPTGTHITVDTPGLYLVYAQVNYANDKDENGFWLYRNQHKELLCATAGGTSGLDVRANTCFTAGVLHLAKGDRVSLKDLAGDRYRVLDHPGRSFVGMVNLSACKLKAEQSGRATA